MSARDSMDPVHVPFSWINGRLQDSAEARFANNVKTVIQGTRTIATIVQSQLIDMDLDVQPMLSTNDLDALVGLMVSSLRMIGEEAENQINRLETLARKGEAV